MSNDEPLYFKTRQAWRSWLNKNHNTNQGIWLVYYKKHTAKPTVAYADAVEEAICFGWIDGQVKTIDDERYMQRFTPRRVRSIWSELNIGRAEKMIKQGLMTEFGLEAFSKGMKRKARVPSSRNFTVPVYLKQALSKNKTAWKNFQSFPPSARLAYVYWVDSAKRDETREKRIKISIELLAKNKKLGLV